MLPPCFMPTADAGHLLARVHQGLDVRHEDMVPLIRSGLVEVYSFPTPRSGYELTQDGEEALGRYVYSLLAGGRASE